jgi:hypothetical protein
MPYSVGEKGSYGCSGYPAVKDDGEVMGCHDTKEKAQAQITAINISEAEKSMPTLTDEELDQVDKQSPCWDGYVQRGMKEKDGKMVPNCVPASKSELGSNDSGVIVSKQDGLQEGMFVMGATSEGIVHGMVEHIMWEGGTLGTPGSEYALESMPPENPAMSVRIYQEDSGEWKPTAYSIGMMYQDAEVVEMNNHSMPEEMQDEMIELSNKSLFQNFGKDFTQTQRLTQIFPE